MLGSGEPSRPPPEAGRVPSDLAGLLSGAIQVFAISKYLSAFSFELSAITPVLRPPSSVIFLPTSPIKREAPRAQPSRGARAIRTPNQLFRRSGSFRIAHIYGVIT